MQRHALQADQRQRRQTEHRQRNQHFKQGKAGLVPSHQQPPSPPYPLIPIPARPRASASRSADRTAGRCCRSQAAAVPPAPPALACPRSEEHTSELQSLMRISYAVFCLKKKIIHTKRITTQASKNT